MKRKNPDIREVKRLKKLEDAKQNLRWRAAEMVKDGFSYRKAAEILNRSHQFVKNWVDKLLVKKRVKGGFVYVLRKGAKELVETRKIGRAHV